MLIASLETIILAKIRASKQSPHLLVKIDSMIDDRRIKIISVPADTALPT